MSNIPLAYGGRVFKSLRKKEPMISFEWSLSVKRGDGERKPWGILGVQQVSEEIVFDVYDGKCPVSRQYRW